MIELVVVVIQNCLNLLKVERGAYSETCLTSSHEGTSEVTNAQDEDPLLMFPVIKAEHEVGCVCVDMHIYVSVPRSILQGSRIACFPSHFHTFPHEMTWLWNEFCRILSRVFQENCNL